MGVTDLLSRLQGLRQTAPGRFVARCPAHEDRTPSLAVRELPDGRLLVHCFGGCEVGDVLAAVGLRMADLFPDPLPRLEGRPIRRPFSADEALTCLAAESQILAICGGQLADGKPLSANDQARLDTAVGRIATVLEVAHGT
jgi:hypothetical protein